MSLRLYGPEAPPPLLHPVTGRRLLGGWLCLGRQSMRATGPMVKTTLQTSPWETAKAAGWTCAVWKHSPKSPLPVRRFACLPKPRPQADPVLIVDAGIQAFRGFGALTTTVRTLRPLVVLTRPALPASLAVTLPTVWRVRETLPGPTVAALRDALLALTSPDPRALHDPRLHCWLLPPLLPEDPDLPLWRTLVAARPEVPVLVRASPWRPWEVMRTLTLLWPWLHRTV